MAYSHGWRVFLLSLVAFPSESIAIEVAGDIQDAEWGAEHSPVVVSGDLSVASLTITEGVTVELQGNYRIVVNGVLRAYGTPENPVRFRPSTGVWGGIYFEDTIPGSEFEWCRFEGAEGSAVSVVRAAPRFSNCTFVGNTGTHGGAIFAELGSSDLIVENSCFLDNVASTTGGAIYAVDSAGQGEAALMVSASVFSGNIAGSLEVREDTAGGALAVVGDAHISNSTFKYNEAQAYTIYVKAGRYTRGGALYAAQGHTEVTGSSFQENACRMSGESHSPDSSNTQGGAVYLDSGALVLRNSLLTGNTLVASNLVGSERFEGSAILVSQGEFELVNSTLADNLNDAALRNEEGSVRVQNSILFFNNESSEQIAGGAEVSYSNVQNCFEGQSNVCSNPVLNDAYAIGAPSEAIDGGDPGAEYYDVVPPGLGSSTNDMGYTGGPGAVVFGGMRCYRDSDGDGYGDPSRFIVQEACGCGHIPDDSDCDDRASDANPGAPEGPPDDESCADGMDNDCDGLTDDEDPACRDCDSCDDGLFCNGIEVCEADRCVVAIPSSTDDGVSCTVDSCDEDTDTVTHVPDDTLCAPDEICGIHGCSQPKTSAQSNETDPVDEGTSAQSNETDPVDEGTSAQSNETDPVDEGTSAQSSEDDPKDEKTSAQSSEDDPKDEKTSAQSSEGGPKDERTSAQSNEDGPKDERTSAQSSEGDSKERASAQSSEDPEDEKTSKKKSTGATEGSSSCPPACKDCDGCGCRILGREQPAHSGVWVWIGAIGVLLLRRKKVSARC